MGEQPPAITTASNTREKQATKDERSKCQHTSRKPQLDQHSTLHTHTHTTMHPILHTTVRGIKAIPVVLTTLTLTWSGYTLTTTTTPILISSSTFPLYITVLGLLLFLMFLGLGTAAYAATVSTSTANYVPLTFRSEDPEEIVEIERKLLGGGGGECDPHARALGVIVTESKQRTRGGKYRYCRTCRAFKPDRAHHSSAIGRCVLRFDHFCPWVNNAIGFGNHKTFILFVLYIGLAAVIAAVFSGSALFGAARPFATPLSVIILFFVSTSFSFALLGFAGMHIRLAMLNMTTLESFEGSAKVRNMYRMDSGFENVAQLFGDRVWDWWVPLRGVSTVDGVVFPVRDGVEGGGGGRGRRRRKGRRRGGVYSDESEKWREDV